MICCDLDRVMDPGGVDTDSDPTVKKKPDPGPYLAVKKKKTHPDPTLAK